MPVERPLPQTPDLLLPRRTAILNWFLQGQSVASIAEQLKSSEFATTLELWEHFQDAIESSSIEAQKLLEVLKSGRLKLDRPILPAYVVKPWLNKYQWQVFELYGQGELPEAVVQKLSMTKDQVRNLGIQITDRFQEKGLEFRRPRSHRRIPIRTLAPTMWHVQDSLAPQEKQLIIDVVDSGRRIGFKNHHKRRQRNKDENWITIFNRYRLLFHTPDNQNFLASLPIKIPSVSRDGIFWLDLGMVNLNHGHPILDFISSSSETTQEILKQLKVHFGEFITQWQRDHRKEPSLKTKITAHLSGIKPEIIISPSATPTNNSEGFTATERELVEAAKANDATAMAELYDTYFQRVYRYMLVRTGNPQDAEDLTEITFTGMLENIWRFEWRGARFSAWLFRIAHNALVSQWRRDGTPVRSFPLSEALPLGTAGPEEQVEAKLALDEVMKAVQRLSEAQRQVIYLRFVDNLTVSETAQVLGKTKSHVKVIQHKAVAKLKEILSGQYDQKQEALEKIRQQIRAEQRRVRQEQQKRLANLILQILINADNTVSSIQISERLNIPIWEVRDRIKQLRHKQGIPIKTQFGRKAGYYLEADEEKLRQILN